MSKPVSKPLSKALSKPVSLPEAQATPSREPAPPESRDLSVARAAVGAHADLDTSALLLAFWADRLSRRLTSWRLNVCKEAGMDPTEAHILVVLRINGVPPGPPLTWLRQVMRLTSGGISRAIDRMVAAGTLTQEATASDRRSVEIGLTPEGVAAADRLLELLSREQAALLEGIPDERRAQLLSALDELSRCYEHMPLPA